MKDTGKLNKKTGYKSIRLLVGYNTLINSSS